MVKKAPVRHVLPAAYPISKVGLSIKEVTDTILNTLKTDPDWMVTKTEVVDLKAVIDKGKKSKRARIVGTLQVFLKCR